MKANAVILFCFNLGYIRAMDILEKITTSFVPLFFAMNSLGIVPIYLSFVNVVEKKTSDDILNKACLAALVVAFVFLVAGKLIFHFLGITQDDFRIGGGLVLMIIGVLDLLFSHHETRRKISSELAIVPLGIPLIVGPAVLTTLLVLVDQHGLLIALISLVMNLGIVWFLFRYSYKVERIMGVDGMKAFGKVASLFLVAIAVMMIRVGVTNSILH